MVNASLNWASIVGIVLASCGAYLFFLRSFKPHLSKDKDIFYSGIGLLCGGILFFQGWRLDPILQFGQFLLAATTISFAYDSVRLRKIENLYMNRKFDASPIKRSLPNETNDDWNNINPVPRMKERTVTGTSVKCSYCGASVDI